MTNKTCVECKHLNRKLAFCRACGAKWIKETDGATCQYFEQKTPPTNGDVIRQGGNRALAQFAYMSLRICRMCTFSQLEEGRYECTAERGQSCIDGIESWLNAPAESEENNE